MNKFSYLVPILFLQYTSTGEKLLKYREGKDLVSYRGPRLMVRVDMSVDTRSTHGLYLGRCIHRVWSIVGRVSDECRSSIGRYIGDVSTDHWITFGREIDRQSVAIASPECRQFIGEPSVKYQ